MSKIEWTTADRVQFVVDKWSDRDKAALLAALLVDAEEQGKVIVDGELWVRSYE